MYAARLISDPSRDSFPARARHTVRTAWISLLAVSILMPAAAAAQNGTPAQRLRARDLSVLEDLLSETVQEAIQITVQRVNAENRDAQEAAQSSGATPEIRYVFRSSGQTLARGMFLEDYGAIFTVQVPNLTYAHSALFAIGGDNSFAIVSSPDMLAAGQLRLAQEMQLRVQMSRMRGEIETLLRNLAAEVEASGGSSEKAQRLRESIAEMESAYDDYAREAQLVADARGGRLTEAQEDEARARPADTRFSGLRMLSSADPESLARAEQLAVEQKNQIEGAIITAVVDTLASYGSVLHGLEEDSRLAVVLLPSSYLSQIGSWSRATQRDEEFIISVRYRDIEDLDRGSISPEEFGSRIRVESRLGQPRQRR